MNPPETSDITPGRFKAIPFVIGRVCFNCDEAASFCADGKNFDKGNPFINGLIVHYNQSYYTG